MYIRRKVFSLLQDENGEERYFSTTDIVLEDEEERLFSLVEDEEYLEQKEFGRRQKLARKAERAAQNAEMHSNKSAKLEKETAKILNNPKSSIEDLEKASKNIEKSQRLSNSATREADFAIETALKKNPTVPNDISRKIKIGSGNGVGSGTVEVTPLGKSGISRVELSTNGRKGQTFGGGSGIRTVRRLRDNEGVLVNNSYINTRSSSVGVSGTNQAQNWELENQRSRVEKKLKDKRANEFGITRGKDRGSTYKSNKAAERARIAAEEQAAREAAEKATKTTSKEVANTVAKETGENLAKKGFKLGKGGKIALGTAAGLGALYGAKKLYDKNKKDNK